MPNLMENISKKTLLLPLLIATILFVSIFAGQTYAVSQPKDTKAGSKLEERIAQRKKERGVKLDETKRDRLISSCKNGQNSLRNIRDGYVPVAAKRTKAYNQVDSKLWVIIGGLKYIEFDTFNLERQRTDFAKRVDNYERIYGQYRQTLSDAVDMNCAADPVGFQALIETARVYNVQTRDQLNDITKFVNDSIRQTLSSYSENLKVKASN